MSQRELLALVAAVLRDARVGFMVTGSTVSSLQGAPRSTHDVDVVVALARTDEDTPRRLAAAFTPPDYYLDEAAARAAVAGRGMFNLLQVRTGFKVDFWLLTDDAFDQSRFARRRTVPIDPLAAGGQVVDVSAPEDTILMKLRWSALSGGSAKQFTDALRVYEVQRPTLDLAYIDAWADRLALRDEWDRLRREAIDAP